MPATKTLLLLTTLLLAGTAAAEETNPGGGPLTSAGKIYRDTAANVQVALPGLGWIFSYGKEEDSFEIQLLRPLPNERTVLVTALSAEEFGALGIEAVAKTMRTRFNREMDGMEFGELSRGEHLGMPFVRQDARFRIGSKRFRSACVVVQTSRSLVELFAIAETPVINFDGFVQESLERVSWIDPDVKLPEPGVDAATGVWTSPTFGYSVDLAEGALLRPDLRMEADLFATMIDEDISFAATGAVLGGEDIAAEDLVWALLPRLCPAESVEELRVDLVSANEVMTRHQVRWVDVREPRTQHMGTLLRYGPNALLLSAEVEAKVTGAASLLRSALRRYKEPVAEQSTEMDAARLKSNAISLNYLGVYLHGQDRDEEAAKWFARAVEQDPDFLLHHTNLAFALMERGRNEEALAAVEAAPGHLERTAAYHALRGNILRQLDRLEPAVESFAKAIDAGHRDIDDIDVHVHLLARIQRADEALELLLRLEKEMDSPHLPIFRASVLEDVDRREEGLALLRDLHNKSPGTYPASTAFGWMLVRADRPEEVLQVAATLEKDPDLAVTHAALHAEALLALGRPAEAVPHATRLVELRPQSERAKELLKRSQDALNAPSS